MTLLLFSSAASSRERCILGGGLLSAIIQGVRAVQNDWPVPPWEPHRGDVIGATRQDTALKKIYTQQHFKQMNVKTSVLR